MAIILDGKAVSQRVVDSIKTKTRQIASQGGRTPCLAVILVGGNPASVIYVNNKKKRCQEAGIESLEYLLPEDTTDRELDALIEELNQDDRVDGILVQLPLPAHLDEKSITNKISPAKDVDAFHPENVGKLTLGSPLFAPCTPAGVIKMLEDYGIDISGKECVVVGRSNIVGKPMSLLLLSKHGTVTICHSRTRDLGEVTRRADILVVAIGVAKMITADMIKEGAIVVDVGMNRSEGKLCGDVDFEPCAKKASYITPVPGGVGPMTIAMLLENTMTAYHIRED